MTLDHPPDPANYRSALDARTALCFHIEAHWPGASESERWGNQMTRLSAEVVLMVIVALGILRTAAGGETNNAATPYQLSSNAPACFFADSGIAAVYYRYDTNGRYVLIQKEHSGVWPCDGGKWVQASDGTVTMTSTNSRAGPPRSMVPMTYKQRVFLVWPAEAHKADAPRVCRAIDAATNAPRVLNEFMISAEEFSKGTAKPYPFKFLKGMNKGTAAEE